jgi:alkylhydroperoxidase/carboxymuconolactone decarboxylase family protein YurZ
VLARPGLGARERELVTVATLAALGWERQLVSHVLGASRIGAPPAAVREALAIGARAASAARAGGRERAIADRTWARAARHIKEGAVVRPGSAPDASRAGRRAARD